MKIAINGLGRIGRLVLRQLVQDPRITLVALNDLADTRILAHLLKHDSIHGEAGFPIAYTEQALILDGRTIPVSHGTRPSELPFGDLGAHVVLECTGSFTDRPQASEHLRGSVQHVIVSAPSEDADRTVILGVNEQDLDLARDHVISGGSCTTNCLAPMLKILDDAFGVEYGHVTAVHSYTNDQRILDLPHSDLRRTRAASMSMIPTTTGAVEAIGQVLPHLKDRIDGISVRVPTPDVSLTDLSVTLRRDATVATLNAAFREAAASGSLSPYLEILDEELVSVDLQGRPASCIHDPFLTKAMTPRYVKVFGWYDNEFGYATRLKDLCLHVLEQTRQPSHPQE